MRDKLSAIIYDLVAMRRDEAAGIMVMANSDDTMFEDCIRRLKELSSARAEGAPPNEYICKCGVRVTPHRCSTGTDF